MKWPLLKPVVFYVAGVLAGRAMAVPLVVLFAGSFVFLLAAVVCGLFLRKRVAPTMDPPRGLPLTPDPSPIGRGETANVWSVRLLYAAVLLTGWTNHTLHTAVLSPHDLRRVIGNEPKLATIRGVIAESPSLRVYEFGETPSWRTLTRIQVTAVKIEKGPSSLTPLPEGEGDRSESETPSPLTPFPEGEGKAAQEWRPAAGRVAVATAGALTNLFGGQEVEVYGVLAEPKGPAAQGMFDYRRFLAEQGVYYHLLAETEADWQMVRSPGVAPLADRFRSWGRQVLARGLPGEDESLRLEWALTLGWKTALDEESSEPFIRAATYHIFAVDGLRMGIVFGILFGLLRALSVPRWISGLALLPVLWFYVALTGWPASAIRATVMLSVVIAGWALRRPSNLVNSLLTAAAIILVWEPQQLFQAGFQLSFVVVLAMILMLPPLVKRVRAWFTPDPLVPVALRRRWPGFVRVPAAFGREMTLTSFAAWVGSIPLVAFYFNIITPVSTPANVLAVPLCGLVLASNLASLLLVSWLPGVAELLNHAGWFLMECIRVTSVWFADWPAAWFYVPAPGLYTTLLYYGLLFAVVSGWLLKRAWRPVKLAGAGLAVAAWGGTVMPELFVTRVTVLPANGGMVVYADAVGRRNDLLVDTGNTNAVQFLTKGFLRGQGVNRLPELALSHGDLKHIGGARVLAELFPAGRIWTSTLRFRSTAYRRLVGRFREEGCQVETVGRKERVGAWEVLHPERDDRFSRADDGALVLRREIKGTPLLLLNDLGEAGQEMLLRRTQDLRAEIVVAGLPTTGEALGEELLQAIRPDVIIVADSEYPASERASAALRERLRKWGGTVIYTRDTGTIAIEFRRGKWEVRSVNGGRWQKMLNR